MSSDSSHNDGYPVFEVHRVGNLDKSATTSLELNTISKTYTELVPITSLDQFAKATALATVPPPSTFVHC